MNEKVSVIVTIYNSEKTLERCVDSIINQTYNDLEIILLNDGSVDSSKKIISEYQKKDPRIVGFNFENHGVSYVRNYGIETASGEYIVFVDSDDYLKDTFVATMLKLMRETGGEIAVCQFERFVTEPKAENMMIPAAQTMSNVEALWKMRSDEGMRFTAPWGKIYKRELFSGIEYPVGRISEDEATTYKLLDRAKKVVVTDDVLYFYCISNQNSITSDLKYLLKTDILEAYEEQEKYFLEQGYTDLARATWKTYLSCTKNRYLLLTKAKNFEEQQKYLNLYKIKWKNGAKTTVEMGYRFFLRFPRLYTRLKLIKMEKK